MGFFRRDSQRMPASIIKNADEDICASCGCHWMQNCDCTWEEVRAAEEKRSLKGRVVTTYTWKEIKEKFKID